MTAPPAPLDVPAGGFPDPHASAADADVDVDLTGRRRIHVVGVGGAGMRAIAEVLATMGHEVSGSDLKDGAGIDRLRSLGVDVAVGHAAANVAPGVELVAVSTAIPASNPEVGEARARGIPVASRADVLAAIAAQRDTVAVAGTHGKTTTSSMLALVLVEAGLHPSFLIGGDLNEIGTSAVWDRGRWFVVEADESDGTFLVLPRTAAVVTNVEPDHLEHYPGGFEGLRAAFEAFVRGTGGFVVVGIDDPGAAALAGAGGPAVVSFGLAAGADYRATQVAGNRDGVRFHLEVRGRDHGEIVLPMGGEHNVRNALAAAAVAMEAGAPVAAVRAALGRFAGVARRFERRGTAAGVTFVDDYAHLPAEVRAMTTAAREGGWERVVAVFQPHRFSRTATIGPSFGGAFEGADIVVITDVYPAGEPPRPGVTGMIVVRAVLDADPRTRVVYLPHRSDVVRFLTAELRRGDLCLTLGAGDLTTLPDELRPRLAARAGAGATGAGHPGRGGRA